MQQSTAGLTDLSWCFSNVVPCKTFPTLLISFLDFVTWQPQTSAFYETDVNKVLRSFEEEGKCFRLSQGLAAVGTGYQEGNKVMIHILWP